MEDSSVMKNQKTKTISIADNFSPFPAGRFENDGDFSGTAFRDNVLVPALREYEKVVVRFDNVAGFGSSFLEEAFGGLVRIAGFDLGDLRMRLELAGNECDLKDYIQLSWRYMDDAAKRTI